MSSMFGPELSHATTSSPVYRDEAKEWRDRTDCVSMVISDQAHEGAVIYLYLGIWEGTEICQSLYRQDSLE